MKLQGKAAVVTGAGRGMGAATSRWFAAEGARVVVSELNEENGERVASSIVDSGSAVFVRTDVSVESDVENLVARANDEFSGASIFDAEAEQACRAIQFTRLGKNEYIAGMAMYMASSDSKYISRHCIPMDGGASVRGSLPTLDILAAAQK